MLRKIGAVIMLCIPAVLSTILACSWWAHFGVREVYPYLGTFMAIVLWVCVYQTINEKED